MELIRQYQHMLVTGEWTHFLYYALYAWAVMTPRSLGAGIFYCFQPGYQFRFSRGYVTAVVVVSGLLGLSWYAKAEHWLPSDIGSAVCVLMLITLVLTLVPPWGRAVIRALFAWTPYAKHTRVMQQEVSVAWHPQLQLAFITIFNPPDLAELDRNLERIRENFEATGRPFKILAVIDGKGARRNSDLAIPIAKKHCDVVGAGNAQRKRVNLDWMIKYAWQRKWVTKQNAHQVTMHFIDDDTQPHDNAVACRLNRHFANPRIGGVTTAQYVLNPQPLPAGFWQHVMQVFESARNYGSQGFLSLFGAVGCLPGRWYAVRASYITPEFATELCTEEISFFGFWPRLRDPGDDRLITIQVQRNGGLTIMAPDAIVYTETPTRFKALWGMVTRWARSSNVYTIQETPSMVRRPATYPTLFLYWTNIGLAFGTVYIAYVYFPYQFFFGDQDIARLEALAFMVLSMFMTMTIRQIAVVVMTPVYIFLMFIMGFLGIMMQTAQVWGMATFLKSKWTGVRAMGQASTGSQIELEQAAIP